MQSYTARYIFGMFMFKFKFCYIIPYIYVFTSKLLLLIFINNIYYAAVYLDDRYMHITQICIYKMDFI